MRQFQAREGLGVDGIVARPTRVALCGSPDRQSEERRTNVQRAERQPPHPDRKPNPSNEAQLMQKPSRAQVRPTRAISRPTRVRCSSCWRPARCSAGALALAFGAPGKAPAPRRAGLRRRPAQRAGGPAARGARGSRLTGGSAAAPDGDRERKPTGGGALRCPRERSRHDPDVRLCGDLGGRGGRRPERARRSGRADRRRMRAARARLLELVRDRDLKRQGALSAPGWLCVRAHLSGRGARARGLGALAA